MSIKHLAAVAATSVLLSFSGILNAAELKLLRYGPLGEEKPGLIDSQGRIRDLSAHINDIEPATLSDAALEQIAQIPLAELPVVQGNPRIGVPVTGTGKIIAIGFNYVNHAAEMAVELPTEPLVFMKATSALTGPFDEVIQPRNALKLDYESELVVVIGRRAQYISEDEVFDYIAGYTVGHDVSERAFQRERGGQFTKGKSADTFAPVGPYLVTRDTIDDVQNLSVWSEVNGEMRQQGNTADMVFGVKEIVSHLSQFMTLYPGDLIFTGTPAGVGDGMVPPSYLEPGDVVRVGVEGLDFQRQVIASPR
ncbi:MAG: fumarylacetoacetate hydrolase family protein [Proteobacteria bacterium]|jgi:2-keto-4-pentenoate hydratase/2-oxohepta-3-ene-1,7-dioic acid hydratase in catechol pathway|nr:fumarylacetoacetate hydrolase family protein [Pseudomonadota bacterium]MDA1245470.1 fumarylacetoacetate hydrolase family protein [Pseudomonadota bacterium]